MIVLTDKQKELLAYIRCMVQRTGVPPTNKEIAWHFGLASTNGVRQQLKALEEKGVIERHPHVARGIRIVEDENHGRTNQPMDEDVVPLVGAVAAGEPIEAVEDPEVALRFPRGMLPGGQLFCLRVNGDSMTDANIQHGDVAILRKQTRVETGEIAAVIIDGEATLKRVFYDDSRLVLRSENADYPDLTYEQGDVDTAHIAGKLVGMVKLNL